ncbi:Methyladenine glycosylase [Dillenia turbinata]|uniref:Methyladenine glycosylase n=1 Tax=Dillenia turbinata TaxID=194707 RepID=A0AAN8UNN2_9MAGN
MINFVCNLLIENSKHYTCLINQFPAIHVMLLFMMKNGEFREVFLDFDPAAVSKLSEKRIATPGSLASSLLSEQKLRAIIENAHLICKVRRCREKDYFEGLVFSKGSMEQGMDPLIATSDGHAVWGFGISSHGRSASRWEMIINEFGSFNNYIWSFVNNKPIVNQFKYPRQIPIKSAKADAISKDMVRRGFRSVSPTVIYSFMQVVGLTNDHLTSCFRFPECIAAADPAGKNDALSSNVEAKDSEDTTGLGLPRAMRDLTITLDR